MAEISAIPQQPQLGRLAQFLRYLETEKPEFLPSQLDVMGLVRQLTLPQAATVENLSYGNLPFTMPPSGTGAMIPQVKTGRKPEVADLVGMLGGVPGGRAVMDVGTKLSNEAADAIVRTITRNPAATAPQVIQETAMPLMQAVAPRAPGLLETPAKSDLGFYSALEQATTPLQNKGTGAQFLAQIEKTAGVKPEEVKWTGLDEFLKSRQNVTKQEVQDYLAANRVNLQEVRLGEKPNVGAAALLQVGPESLATKFSQYTLPGGENYREILLTLPEGSKSPAYKAQKALDDANKAYDADQSYENYQRVLRARDEADKVGADWKSPEFRSSHFDQPNILAHMRVNDRVVDGKKTLFIEEIQSDWHQAGRKKGYGTTYKPEDITPIPVEKAKSQYGVDNADLFWYFNAPDNVYQIPKSRFAEQSEALNYVLNEKQKMGVPDAPFKTTWHELTLKRAIQEASEKGYDQIAFTTGKTQAERYDLSKQIDEINVVGRIHAGTGELTKSVALDTVNGQSIRLGVAADGTVDNVNDPTMSNLIGKNLDEVVGKELAKKIIEGGSQTISGEGLKVGGEGMKGFYDQILPKTLDKLGKKFDAKVGKTEMDGVEVWAMDITPKMRESVLTKGQPLFAATPAIPAAGLLGDENE